MTNEKLTHLLKIAYRWGRDNGSNRSEKNFNDLLQTEAINQALRIHDVVRQSEQLVCPHQATRTPNEEKTGKRRQCGRKIKAN